MEQKETFKETMDKAVENKEFNPNEMKNLFEQLAKVMKENEKTLVDDEIKYPIEVNALQNFRLKPEQNEPTVGQFASIRPCGDEYKNKTYLGIYLGRLPVGQFTTYHPDTKNLAVVMKQNPAIYVPELKKIIYGMESWWSLIKTETDLKQITDADIADVWYVKALKDMTAKDKAEAPQ